jgi:hypothetical protein
MDNTHWWLLGCKLRSRKKTHKRTTHLLELCFLFEQILWVARYRFSDSPKETINFFACLSSLTHTLDFMGSITYGTDSHTNIHSYNTYIFCCVNKRTEERKNHSHWNERNVVFVLFIFIHTLVKWDISHIKYALINIYAQTQTQTQTQTHTH